MFEDIKHAAAEQMRLLRETAFAPVTIARLREVANGGAPAVIDGLRAVALDALHDLQA